MAVRDEPTINLSTSLAEGESNLLEGYGGDSKNKGVDNKFTKIEFTGNAKEYFGIWVVNLILSIITIGIYSAWAKVRRETYFKNNTKLLETGFAYHATGGQIFKGRLIAVLALFAINIVSVFLPVLGLLILPVFLVLLPWIINNSIRFSLRMTSFRNVRFNWRGTYWETLWFLVIAPVVGLVSLGTLTPLISKSYYAYFARSNLYGTTPFTSNSKVSEFYYAFLIAAILPAMLFSCLFIPLFVFADGSEGLQNISVIQLAIIPMIYFFIFSIAFIYPVLCRNIMVRSLNLGDVLSFDSQINPLKFIWITLSNLVLILITLGLMLPWAKVRMYRYLSNSTLVQVNGDVENFVDDQKSSQSALGEAVSDLEGIEVAI